MTDPTPKQTLPEALDAARDGKEFQQVIQGLFRAPNIPAAINLVRSDSAPTNTQSASRVD